MKFNARDRAPSSTRSLGRVALPLSVLIGAAGLVAVAFTVVPLPWGSEPSPDGAAEEEPWRSDVGRSTDGRSAHDNDRASSTSQAVIAMDTGSAISRESPRAPRRPGAETAPRTSSGTERAERTGDGPPDPPLSSSARTTLDNARFLRTQLDSLRRATGVLRDVTQRDRPAPDHEVDR